MRYLPATGALLAALALAGCGGGDPRQDADERGGEYKLEVVRAAFPQSQRLAEKSTFVVAVRNADSKTAPNIAVTVETDPGVQGEAPTAFGQRESDPELADPARPIWIIDSAPEGADSAYTNTWQLGALEPGETATFEWRVTAVKAGDYTINYEVSPGLDGKATVASTSGRTSGNFNVSIDDEPAQARVDGDGDVVRLDE